MPASVALRFIACCLVLAVSGPRLTADDAPTKKAAEKIKEIAGAAEFLRSVPKHFATLKAVDAVRQRVTLLIEGESLPKVWPLAPDAEVKVAGWWGRLDQLRIGDRVWIWFKWDRNKQPVAVSMLADEISEQDIHGPGVTLEARTADTLTLKPLKGDSRVLKIATADSYRGNAKASLDSLPIGEKVYVQSTGDQARLILDSAAFEDRRTEQKTALRQRWTDEGLPGTVVFQHHFSGEMDFMLDHEAMRWGRSLKPGDQVALQASPPIKAVVKHVRPWREHTELRLVVSGVEQADLSLGERLRLKRTPPALEVDLAVLPPDLDRPRSKDERTEWFLASIYCTCKVKGDVCTGMFYSLASCNPNGCGMPQAMRQRVAALLDQGLTDRQIFEELLKEQGPDLLRPHLLP